MPRTIDCQFCRSELDPAQQFRYLVEVQTFDNPVMLAAIRRLPHDGGVPLRVCRPCQGAVEAGRREPRGRRRHAPEPGSAVVTAVAALGVWAITAKLGKWLGGVA